MELGPTTMRTTSFISIAMIISPLKWSIVNASTMLKTVLNSAKKYNFPVTLFILYNCQFLQINRSNIFLRIEEES